MSGDTWPKFYMDMAPTFDYARIKFQLHILPSFGVTLLLLVPLENYFRPMKNKKSTNFETQV